MEATDFKGLDDHFYSRRKNPGINDKKQEYYKAEEVNFIKGSIGIERITTRKNMKNFYYDIKQNKF